jgi:2-polyprenyl-6-methoxyphenol hydroxylase-like FAD-dependent oxidoreductase
MAERPPHAHSVPGPSADVCVVGGGPAGLAAAIASAQRGLRVEVVDAMQPPIDKACGEGLMPDSLAALAQLGISLEDNPTQETGQDAAQTPGFPLTGIRFLSADGRTQTEAAFPNQTGRGVRRLQLHQLLFERALTLGVRFHWQTVVQSIQTVEAGAGNDPASAVTIHTNRGSLAARYLIGADGLASRIRTWANLDQSSLSRRRLALRQHFALAPWTNLVEVHWSPTARPTSPPSPKTRSALPLSPASASPQWPPLYPSSPNSNPVCPPPNRPTSPAEPPPLAANSSASPAAPSPCSATPPGRSTPSPVKASPSLFARPSCSLKP